jgi:hypothetical protein
MHGPAQVSNVAAVKYTAPSGQVATLQHIHVQNPSNVGVAFTLAIGTNAASTRVYDAYTIGAGQVLDVFCKYVLNAGETIQALSGTNNVLTLTLDGQTADTAVAGSASSWKILYEVDFTLLANQSMAGPGSYVIDGKTWWVKGALAASQSVGLGTVFTTTGLVRPGIGSRNGALSGQSFDGSATLAFATFFMPFAQLAGFNPVAPIFVETLTEGWLVDSNGVKVVIGIVEAESDGAAYAAASRSSEVFAGYRGNSAGVHSQNASGWVEQISETHLELTVYEMAVLRSTARSGTAMWNASGGLVGPDGTGIGSQAVNGVAGAKIGPVVNGSKLGFMFGEENGVSQTGAAWLKALRVYQPIAA